MVDLLPISWVHDSVDWLLAQENVSPVQIPEPTRTAAMMALLAIALLGLLLVVFILLGGHWVRRLGKHRHGPVVPPDRLPGQLGPSHSGSAHTKRKLPPDIDTDETFRMDDTLDT